MLLAFAASAETLAPVATKDKKVVRRWTLPGDPRGLAFGADGTLYVGLAQSQEIVAVDPATGAVKKRVVLDSAHIAATKELVTLRTSPDRTRLFVANGSDESAVILSLPDLAVLREITMEGETIRDVIPDPKGRYVYVLGRRVHVFDRNGHTKLRALNVDNPMALAVSASSVAVFSTLDFGTAKATGVTLFDTQSFTQLAREPLQTQETIEGAMFAAKDRALLAFSRDSMLEKSVISRPAKSTTTRLDMGELVKINRVCMPQGSGPQIALLAASDTQLVYGERRCSASGTFWESARNITPASVYGISAYALAYDPQTNALAATDPAGFLTIYRMPRPAVAQ